MNFDWYTITDNYGAPLASFARWEDAESYADNGVQRRIYQYGREINQE